MEESYMQVRITESNYVSPKRRCMQYIGIYRVVNTIQKGYI